MGAASLKMRALSEYMSRILTFNWNTFLPHCRHHLLCVTPKKKLNKISLFHKLAFLRLCRIIKRIHILVSNGKFFNLKGIKVFYIFVLQILNLCNFNASLNVDNDLKIKILQLTMRKSVTQSDMAIIGNNHESSNGAIRKFIRVILTQNFQCK